MVENIQLFLNKEQAQYLLRLCLFEKQKLVRALDLTADNEQKIAIEQKIAVIDTIAEKLISQKVTLV